MLSLLLEGAARFYEHATAIDDTSVADLAWILSDQGPDLSRHNGEMLVYVYGESTVWGAPVREVGLVAQMQYYARLQHPGRDIRVVNLGVRGADSSQLLRLVRDTIGNRPDLAVVLCGHNEFLHSPVDEPLPAVVRHVAVARVAAGLLSRPALSVDWRSPREGYTSPISRTSPAGIAREARFRSNMAAIVRDVRGAGVHLVLTTLPSNLKDWPPVFRHLEPHDDPSRQDAYVAAMEEGLADADRGDASALRRIVDSWSAAAGDDPMVRFLRGRLRLLAGDKAGALADLRFARDHDPVPWRMNEDFMDCVRALARDERVPLADLDAETCAVAVPGSDLFADNVHPSPDEGRLIAAALLRTAEVADLLPPPVADESPLAEFLASAGYVAGSPLRLQYLIFNGQYAMRRPFFHFALAEKSLAQAAAEFPSAWVAHANLATLRLWQGRVGEGVAELRRAESLHGGPLDLADREAVPQLREVLNARGLR